MVNTTWKDEKIVNLNFASTEFPCPPFIPSTYRSNRAIRSHKIDGVSVI